MKAPDIKSKELELQTLEGIFEEVLDKVHDFVSLKKTFWEFCLKIAPISWGCLYWHQPAQAGWLRDEGYALDSVKNLPDRLPEGSHLVQKTCMLGITGNKKLCDLELPFYFENEDIGLGVDWALAFRFGLENRIMAVMILGKKKRKTPYFNYEIESLQRFLKILYRTYEKLELSNQLLAADKNITVSMLAGGIAHEIGNNITPIIGRAELLLNFLKIMPDRELAAKYESQASVIYNQGCKIARMAKNLTKLSRPLKLEVDKLNLEAELRSAVELMAETAGKIKHFKLDDPDAQYILNLNFAPDLPQIRGDSQQLQQVFINLIINAAHAIEDKGRGAMTIGTKLSPDEGVVAFIQDTGCGMSNETMDNMWKPFFTTKKSGKGTGLGMAIVKNVLEAHQAKISVSSKLGEGTIFEIRFEPVKE